MGLTTWKNAPDGRILKSDTPIAKNYLAEKQIRQLERAVTGYLDVYKRQADRCGLHRQVFSADSIIVNSVSTAAHHMLYQMCIRDSYFAYHSLRS